MDFSKLVPNSNGAGKKYLLNVGLAFTLLYAGIDQLVHPLDWVGFLPQWMPLFGQTPTQALLPHSIACLVLAVGLLLNYKIRWVAWATALFFASIVLANGIGREFLIITFRDVGLTFTALYLALDYDRL